MNAAAKIEMPKPYLVDLLEEYIQVEKKIGDIIQSTGYKNDFIAKKLKLPISTYYTKKRTKSFTAKEVFQIVRMLDDDDADDNAALLELAKSRMDDEFTSGADYKKFLTELTK